MLKIYRWTNKYELCNDKYHKQLSTLTGLCIKDESDAVDTILEYDAYTKAASRAYCKNAELKQKRKGIKAIYWTYDGAVYAKQWLAPNAKLIVHCSYEEDSCSMSRLMELNAPDVIAYLKQEGLILSVPS